MLLHHKIRDIVTAFSEVLCIWLGNDPSVAIPPTKIEFERKKRLVEVQQRNHSPAQLQFLKRKSDELIGPVFLCRNSSLSTPTHQQSFQNQARNNFVSQATIKHSMHIQNRADGRCRTPTRYFQSSQQLEVFSPGFYPRLLPVPATHCVARLPVSSYPLPHVLSNESPARRNKGSAIIPINQGTTVWRMQCTHLARWHSWVQQQPRFFAELNKKLF